MEYKRVKPISYDKGVPKYQASGILNLARVVLPRLAGAAGVAGAVAGAKDYTGPSDQELYNFVFGKRWEAPPVEEYVNYPNYNEIIESQRSDEPIGTIYMPETHKTSASIPTYARPIPVSYEAIAKGDSIDVPGGRAEVEDIDNDGRMILGPTVPTSQNPQNKKPEDDKEKDKKKNGVKESIKQESKKVAKNIGKTYGRAAKGLAYSIAYGAPLLGLGLWAYNSFKPEETAADSTLNAQTKQIIELNKIGQIKQNDEKISSMIKDMTTTPTTPTTSEESFVPRDSLIARRKRRYEKEGL